MKRYVPRFILNHLYAGELHGTLRGLVLLLDIKDFSLVSKRMLQEGNTGAEYLAAYLNQAFSEPIRLLGRMGGFVSLFVGDAVCFIFPEPLQPGFLNKARAVSAYLQEPNIFSTPWGDYPIVIKQMVAYGKINWDIFITDTQNEYLFSGQPFIDLQELHSTRQLISFSAEVRKALGPGRKRAAANSGSPRTADGAELEPGLVHTFLHPRFLKLNPDNEVRIAASCFISFKGLESGEYRGCIVEIARQAQIHHAYVNKLDYTDKGLVALVLFGVPQSEGHTLFRICDFSLKLLELHPRLAIGIGWGSVFAGYTGNQHVREYSILGDAPNRTARLMNIAQSGEIIAGNVLWGDAHFHYEFHQAGEICYKGMDEPVPYYRLTGKKPRQMDRYPFVGRKKETSLVLTKVRQSITSRTNQVIYISGDPGIGKSRFVQELLLQVPPGKHRMLSHSCDSTHEPSLELIRTLLRDFLDLDRTELRTGNTKYFDQCWSAIMGQKPESDSLKTVIGSVFDLSWPGSVWEKSGPAERPELLQQSLIEGFRILANREVIVLNIDDGQWLDPESLNILRLLGSRKSVNMVILSACRYLPGEKRVDFRIPDFHKLYLELPPLSIKDSVQLCTVILGSDINARQARLLTERTTGNPLYIENISAYVREAESVEEGLNKLLKQEGYNNFGLSDVINSRLDMMDGNLRECILAASVLGLEFDTDILTEMLGRDISLELEHCSRHHIWYPTYDSQYAFSHILIKENAYSLMMRQKLLRYHESAAKSMEQFYSEKLMAGAEQIGYHFERAGMLSQAAKYYDIAADYYWGKVQYANSARLFQKAIEIQDQDPNADPLLYGEYVFHYGLLLHYLNDYPAAEKQYLLNMKIQLRARAKDSVELSPYINNLGRLYKDMERFSKAEPLLKQSLEMEIRVKHTYGAVADRQNNLAHLYSKQGKHKKALPLYLSALEGMKAQIGPESVHMGFMLNNVGMTYLALGKLELAADYLRQAIRVKLKHYAPNNPELAMVYFNLGRFHILNKEPDKAENLFLKALRVETEAFGADHPRNLRTNYELYKLAQSRDDFHTASQCKTRMRSILKRKPLLGSHERQILLESGIDPDQN